MGQETHIRRTSDRFDEKKLAPFLGNDFTWDIALGYLFDDNSFLSKDEWKILTPQNTEDIIDEKPNPVNPADLISVLQKIKFYLKDHQDTLPFEIDFDYDKMEKEGLSCEIIINDSGCWIQGDSAHYEVSSKVKIINLPMQPNEVELWVDVKDKIEIEGRTYYLRKVTRYDKYKELINRIIDICEDAQNNNENVYWTVWT